MKSQEKQEPQNRGICSKCHKVVLVHHAERDGKIYLVKECPDCGVTESLVSCNAGRYQEKRAMAGYEGEAEKTCSLKCPECNIHKPPTLVFIDVTNRCNMNCPICLANIPAMGFRFDPPMEYFEKIFDVLSRMNPRPKIELFGGEPTVREDLIEMIELAKKKYGLSARVVTNGIRLADEEYCKTLLATETELMFSFDGRSPRIYERMRKHHGFYEKKLKALENVGKHRKSKITIMCCVGKGVNDEYLADLLDFCHEQRNCIAALDLIPLTATWGPEEVDAESATIEDVEQMMAEAAPGTEFFPASMLYCLTTLRSTFDVGRLTFGGAHPNCEAVSVMISDGRKYHPASKYLNRSFKDVIIEMVALDKETGKKLEQSLIARMFGRRGRQVLYGAALLKFFRRNINTREVFAGGATLKLLRIIWGFARGVKMKDLLRANTKCHGILRLMILPFEEKECIESARLVDCPASFAYEHPLTREIRMMPVCAWTIYKNNILRKTSEHYGVDHATGQVGLDLVKNQIDPEAKAAGQRTS
jgi:uncharacterized radical SAM superfamily Fe-S cluster-containing enzyme